MSKKLLISAKVETIIHGPDGPTRVYGEGRRCKECNSPLSQYSPAIICSLCQIEIYKKEVMKKNN